ncbi:MAG TPA: polysaccharide deacetylase family protein [Candidatus Polarisedimenticolia bacterium]|nr:polysaccharide deacetylase family protein [Candidatus Polarisedimenticolia bacterium]
MTDTRAQAEFALAWALRFLGRLEERAGPGREPRAVILAYHRILPRERLRDPSLLEDLVTPVESFAAQVKVLAGRHSVLPLEELVRSLREDRKLPERCVCITLDDGYADNYLHAFPLLRKHRLPATIFLSTGFIGGGRGLFWWDEICRWRAAGAAWVELEGLGRCDVRTLAQRDRLLADLKRLPMDAILDRVRAASARLGLGSGPNAEEGFLTWDQVREMQKDGISFGAHTVSHCLLPRETSERRGLEIRQSRADLQRETGRPCTLFCYPNGVCDEETRREVIAAGYEGAMATIPRDVLPDSDLHRLPRKTVNFRTGMTVFRFKLSPHPERIKRLLEPAAGSSA